MFTAEAGSPVAGTGAEIGSGRELVEATVDRLPSIIENLFWAVEPTRPPRIGTEIKELVNFRSSIVTPTSLAN